MEPNSTNHTRQDICSPGLLLPILDESGWNPVIRGILYFLVLIYSFIGVSVVTDIFMGAAVTITSQTKKVYLAKSRIKKIELNNNSVLASQKDGEPEFIEVRVWNDTVANLTLMALGTSASEILLAYIEIIGHNFESGQLGPGAIVGSAAFNLLMITTICLMSIPNGEVRRKRLFKVFLVCPKLSIFAYVSLAKDYVGYEEYVRLCGPVHRFRIFKKFGFLHLFLPFSFKLFLLLLVVRYLGKL